MFNYELLRADARRSDRKMFDGWMSQVAQLCSDFWEWSDIFYPFHDNEYSAVSLLLAAAARQGHLPVAEYRLRKRGVSDKRQRRNGRADLWFVENELAYSFEFKKSWNVASLSNLRRSMHAAEDDLRCVPLNEADHGYAGVIAPFDVESEVDCYERFAREVDVACWVGMPSAFDVFFYFNRRRV